MPRKRIENKTVEIRPEFGNILVCNKKNLRPFVEIIIEEPENISHQNLGTLIGVFEITDTTEDSSYVVNYLVSIIKKEYFSKAKRGPVESLESALHKANLALANLAEHKNINWLGKLNALVAVTERSNLHLSQTGTASAFLLRSQTLTDISEGLAPSDSDPYPLKTFVSVSSGRLQENDKLIITTANIFDIFSLEEIKKSALRFSNEEFIQFLKTALSNELERAAVLVADLKTRKRIILEKAIASQKEINAFSRDAFTESSHKKKPQELEETIQKEIRENPEGFVDEKTGHIYIKENYEPQNYQEEKERYLEKIIKKSANRLKSVPVWPKNIPKPALKRISVPKINLNTEKIKSAFRQTFQHIGIRLKGRSYALKLSAKIAIPKDISKNSKAFLQKNSSLTADLLKKIARKLIFVGKLIIPSLARIKRSFDGLEYRQKIYALIALLFIFVAPIFIIKIQDKQRMEQNALVEIENRPVPLPLEQDINVQRIENITSIFSTDNIRKIIYLNEKIFAITQTAIIDVRENESYPIPEGFSSPSQIARMDDLNLIFLLNQKNEIMSFSPVSKKFNTNRLIVPTDVNILAMGTYLTYIYLLDQKNNQIYRYPRAEGGFGEKTDWIRDSVDLSKARNMVIDENIFISTDSNVIKLFRGRSQDFQMSQTATPINVFGLALGEETNSIFILDKENSRIIHLDSDNSIKKQYYHPEIGSAIDLAVDEKTSALYMATEKEIKTIPLVR